MSLKHKALSVHLLTATGAVFAMLASIGATQSDWASMFLWLLIALIVDGIDGPLARRFDVKKHAPRFDGTVLDLVIDYLTYVFIPAYAMFAGGLLTGWIGWIALLGICFASALYFADRTMKTDNNSFKGFPACWNMVALTLFALALPPIVNFAIIALLVLSIFSNTHFIHPIRTTRWRAVSLPVMIIWLLCGAWAVLHGFGAQPVLVTLLSLSSLYLLSAGIIQQIIPAKSA